MVIVNWIYDTKKKKKSYNSGLYCGAYKKCYYVRDRAPGPFYDVGPNSRKWVESCYYLSK